MKQIEINRAMLQSLKELLNKGRLIYDGIVIYNESLKKYIIRLNPELTIETSRSIIKCELDSNTWLATELGFKYILNTYPNFNLLITRIKE